MVKVFAYACGSVNGYILENCLAVYTKTEHIHIL